ncbi:MAG: hypothetical protein CVU05_06820 [Bacteroidetes bacterium HGW-Bacteroidetes-21]|nr:MAG: hypothetical protein CVU05_06820 [Bacteroidetes bacterium HGW-Bacteroidetes-21]
MALEVYWSKKADKKFDIIITHLTEKWGTKVTTQFVKKVYDFLDILSEFPELGTIEHMNNNIRGFTITKQINIFYLIQNKRIILLNFFDNRQHPKKKLK